MYWKILSLNFEVKILKNLETIWSPYPCALAMPVLYRVRHKVYKVMRSNSSVCHHITYEGLFSQLLCDCQCVYTENQTNLRSENTAIAQELSNLIEKNKLSDEIIFHNGFNLPNNHSSMQHHYILPQFIHLFPTNGNCCPKHLLSMFNSICSNN